MLIAYKNLNISLQKLDINHAVLKQDLHNNTAVIVEGYRLFFENMMTKRLELFKDLSRNNEKIDIDDIRILFKI